MSILRKISSFAATTLVAAAPLCIGFCSAPLAQAAPSDTPATSISTPNPAGQTQDLTDWAKNNCPGGEQFVNDADENTPIYLGYANGKTYLGYTDAKKISRTGQGKKFVDSQSDKKYKKKIGTCVRVAAGKTGQADAQVFFGALFNADRSALSASGFRKNTETVFQVTKKAKSWEPGSKIASRASRTSDNYQEMPYSVSGGQSDSGFKNLLSGEESSVDLRFSQSGFYTIYLKALTTDPSNPDKSYQAEMAYTFIVGKEAWVPRDLQDIVDGKDGDGSDNPPTPDPGETTPDTPTPGHGNEGGDSHPGTNPTSKPGETTPVTPAPRTGDKDGNSHPGTNPDSNAATSDSAAANGSNSDSQAANGDPLKFQADSTSTDLASKQWVRSSSLAVFAFGLGAAGLTGIGLLVFSRLHH